MIKQGNLKQQPPSPANFEDNFENVLQVKYKMYYEVNKENDLHIQPM
jgi:hypothetical protein